MKAIAFYLLMLQRYINSKQKILKWKNIINKKIFLKIFQLIAWKKTGLNGCVYNFFVDYRAFDTSNIIDINKYLMKKHDIKPCLC